MVQSAKGKADRVDKQLDGSRIQFPPGLREDFGGGDRVGGGPDTDVGGDEELDQVPAGAFGGAHPLEYSLPCLPLLLCVP